jgi:hypothetical protein
MDECDIGSPKHASDHTIAVCSGEKILLSDGSENDTHPALVMDCSG